MALEAAAHHARLHVAAQAQLEAQPAPGNLPPRLLVLPDDVAQPPRPPIQQDVQLGARPAGLRLGEMHRQAQPVGGPRRRAENGREDGDLSVGARGRVAAEVEGDDACAGVGSVVVGRRFGAQPRRQREDRLRGREVVPPVDRQDEAHVHGVPVEGLPRAHGVEQQPDVRLGGDPGRGARRGAQLEVDDAVGEEVVEDGRDGVADRLLVRQEVVDVAAEEREEAARRRFPVRSVSVMTWGSVGCPEMRVRGADGLRFEIVIVLAVWHDDQRVLEVSLPGGLLPEPYLVQRAS